MKNRKLRMGMVGGGSDAFIGAIHRRAAFMDNQIELVCGCFSVDPEISKSSGLSYFLPEDRIYSTYQEMFEHEMTLPEGERMDFVTIVTPNRWHFEPAMMALERGFHVVVDKPMTFSLEEAKQLQKKVEETGLILALTHVYSAYPAVKEAKARIAEGIWVRFAVYMWNICRGGFPTVSNCRAEIMPDGVQTRNAQGKQAVSVI